MWGGIIIHSNFNSTAIEVWEWINNFIPHFTMCMITYPWWDTHSQSKSMDVWHCCWGSSSLNQIAFPHYHQQPTHWFSKCRSEKDKPSPRVPNMMRTQITGRDMAYLLTIGRGPKSICNRYSHRQTDTKEIKILVISNNVIWKEMSFHFLPYVYRNLLSNL